MMISAIEARRNELFEQACEEIFNKTYPVVYQQAVANGNDPGDAHELASDEARELARDEARHMAEDLIQDEKEIRQ